MSNMHGLSRMERVSVNAPDEYEEVDSHFELAHGCGDLAVDEAVRVVTDGANVGAEGGEVARGGEGGGENGGQNTTTTVVQGGDVIQGVDQQAQQAEQAVQQQPAVNRGHVTAPSPARTSLWAYLCGALSGAALRTVTALGNVTFTNLDATSSTTSAQYWTALYDAMQQNYPCNNGSGTACPDSVRQEQEALIVTFQSQIAEANPSAASTAAGFSSAGQAALKQTLMGMTANTGIPGLVQYMESYTSPEMSGAAIVIATANVVLAVAAAAYTS